MFFVFSHSQRGYCVGGDCMGERSLLIGEISAGGKTVARLKKEMEKRISFYVHDVVFNINVVQVNSMLIYVIGCVNTPGRRVLNNNVNFLQALAIAGGIASLCREKQDQNFSPGRQ